MLHVADVLTSICVRKSISLFFQADRLHLNAQNSKILLRQGDTCSGGEFEKCESSEESTDSDDSGGDGEEREDGYPYPDDPYHPDAN